MTLWIDAQLSPSIAKWIEEKFSIRSIAVKELGLRDATDKEIFFAARKENVVVVTKDDDFIELVERLGIPPQIIWITSGNTSNDHLKSILEKTFQRAISFIQSGEEIVEISDIGV
ncbi:MAG: DUF5615 family PIN-like protein [Ignavibacteriales bacterium]|nr:DUF5615 family PIN-like protein [Ignavibacteriales bacterium]